ASGPDAFWRLLSDEVNAVTRMPAGRWDTVTLPDQEACGPGTTDAGWGGFLDQVDQFDPGFFGISPREAVAMDPRQRLMLELGWETLENAGIVPGTLRESRLGVFVGAMGDDYATLSQGRGRHSFGHHAAAGLHRSIIANRLSYSLG